MPELTEDAIRDAARRAGLPDAPVRYDDVTASTNATALALAGDGAPEWTLVAAGHQTAGRGRLGRSWESRLGSSLLFSVVFRPSVDPDRAVVLTLLAGAAMARSCASLGAPDVRCKWPNDLLVGDAKVGGILAEAVVGGGRIDHVVVGVGMNLGSAPDVDGAGSLPAVDAADLLAGFLTEARRGYERGLGPEVVGAYRPLCTTIGRRVRATTTDGRVVEGTAVDVDDAGSLVVEGPDGRAIVGFGEVEHLR